MNPPGRNVSSLVLVGFVLVAVYAVVGGVVTRKKLFRQSTEALPHDLRKALNLWSGAHFIGFSFAMSITIFRVVLKFLGSSWFVVGIFFGLSLVFLLLWRPRELGRERWSMCLIVTQFLSFMARIVLHRGGKEGSPFFRRVATGVAHIHANELV
jgi:hypothetical protein